MKGNVLASVAGLFERASIEYVLIGGHAVNTWLEPRFTADVDVVVVAGALEIQRLDEQLREQGYAVDRKHGDGLPSGPDFVRYVSSSSDITLEVQAAKTEFQREVIRRATDPAGVNTATPEDLIVLKLIADRPKDQVDLLGLAKLPDLDWTYVERWAAEWQIEDRLERLRSIE